MNGWQARWRTVSSRRTDGSPWAASSPCCHSARGHGRETTFQQNLTDWAVVADETRKLVDQVLADITAEGRRAVRVGMKMRYAPFETRTRSLTLPAPSNDATLLAEAAVSLLDRVERDRPVRLLGVRLEMTDPEPPTADGGAASAE